MVMVMLMTFSEWHSFLGESGERERNGNAEDQEAFKLLGYRHLSRFEAFTMFVSYNEETTLRVVDRPSIIWPQKDKTGKRGLYS